MILLTRPDFEKQGQSLVLRMKLTVLKKKKPFAHLALDIIHAPYDVDDDVTNHCHKGVEGFIDLRLKAIMLIYNAITQNICFVKGSHKYYLRNKNKAHLN